MSIPMSIYRSAIDEYANESFFDCIFNCVGNEESLSNFIALSTPVNTPRATLLNKCKELSKKYNLQENYKKLHWIPPFNAWEMISIGNLSLALLWHIYKSLPEKILSDEKIIYKLGKISVALPALSNLFKYPNNSSSLDSEEYALLFNKTIPPDKKSSVSSIFSVCDQIKELSEAFENISKQITRIGDFDSLVIPIFDIDMCIPSQVVSLLFAIKNYMCGKYMRFLIVSDIDLLGSALNVTYNQSLTHQKSKKIICSLFDDCIRLPSPSLMTILQSLDNKTILKDKDRIITMINKSGVIPLLPEPESIHLSFNQFNTYLKNSTDKLSVDEYGVIIQLFLIGASNVDSLLRMASLPDLKQFIKKIRNNNKDSNEATRKKGTAISTNHFSIRSTKLKDKVFDFPLSYYEIIYKDSRLLSTFFLSIPLSVSDSQVEQLIRKVIPFL